MPRDPPVADLLRGEGTSPGGPGPAKPGLEEEEGGGVSGGCRGSPQSVQRPTSPPSAPAHPQSRQSPWQQTQLLKAGRREQVGG